MIRANFGKDELSKIIVIFNSFNLAMFSKIKLFKYHFFFNSLYICCFNHIINTIMVDFGKARKTKTTKRYINPVEIYSSLDRKSATGPLRPLQNSILSEWFENRQEDRDLIIKLHTGEGKTLIGLLILQSRIHQDKGPCLYVCPNIQLAKQVALDADKFGVPYCILEKERDLPLEFIEGKKILITHVQKVFNGKTIFKLNNHSENLGGVILDDSHACIDSIRSASTIRISKDYNNELYNSILSLFENDLKEQGEGYYWDIVSSKYATIMQIPYWAWIDKKSEILNLLYANEESQEIMYTFPLIKNNIENCFAFISGKGIEIIPDHIPIEAFGSFNKAEQRILMSATTQDDSFFIKGLGFKLDAILNPLVNDDSKWSGEKMIIIPSLIDENLDRELIRSEFAKPKEKRLVGHVSLVPSYKLSEQYGRLGSIIANKDNIESIIGILKNNQFDKTVVFVNRYDGIDLPDESCRVLLVDSMPHFDSLFDRYEIMCREDSDIINIKIAQKIEQGLGRSVRGEKDYSVILIIGAELVRFIKSKKTARLFSLQTQKQIEIGFEVAQMAKKDYDSEEPTMKVVESLISQCIHRDEDWKGYYQENMDAIDYNNEKSSISDILTLEHAAELANFKHDYELACTKIQEILDKFKLSDSEQGWYMQLLARYKYQISKSFSAKIQKSAFQKNMLLLKPRDGIVYKKIATIDANQIQNIKEWISKHENYEELKLEVDDILDNFSFNNTAEKFEQSVKDIGLLLGLDSQRPDKEIRKGPDNLWGKNGTYFMIECKSEVSESRTTIFKSEAGQMNNHCGWFEETYGKDVPVKRILIIPTSVLANDANFTHDVEILKKDGLNKLKYAIREFIKEFNSFNLNGLTEENIQHYLEIHQLSIKCLLKNYTERPIRLK